jgi:hypothetical protein
MIQYRTRGTPAMAIIGKEGNIRFQHFGGFNPAVAEKKKERDLKKHFEAIIGTKLESEFPDEIVLRERIAIYTEEKGKYTSRHIGTTGNATKACADTQFLDISGIARTGKDGTVKLMLSDFHCVSSRRRFEWPAIVVATPRGRSPVFVTAQASPTSDRKDVIIKIATWDASGSPAPYSFNWMCRVPSYTLIE